jgi:hypothetical protein
MHECQCIKRYSTECCFIFMSEVLINLRYLGRLRLRTYVNIHSKYTIYVDEYNEIVTDARFSSSPLSLRNHAYSLRLRLMQCYSF